MDVRQRILTIRLLDKLADRQGYADRLGLELIPGKGALKCPRRRSPAVTQGGAEHRQE